MRPQTSHPSEIEELADWSEWLPFTIANVATVPRLPGVYLFRRSTTGPSVGAEDIAYVGRAAERRGKGVQERLRIYVTGRAPHSGLGNLALERALADLAWLGARLERVEAGDRMTVQDWARDAVAWASLEFSYATVSDGPASAALESATIAALHDHNLWNRRR
ncbi:hypothetical protein FXB39_10380 [Nocardioides sp. BGMRC 2183]|nr:hypothetical protein FXB39_10380 [Nocardioides sp. BGMRC 2183]